MRRPVRPGLWQRHPPVAQPPQPLLPERWPAEMPAELPPSRDVPGGRAGRWMVVDTHAGPAVVRVEPFETIELALGRWWMPGDPGATED